jgi:hypothetical protein
VYLLFVSAEAEAAAGTALSALQGAIVILFHPVQYREVAEDQVDHPQVKG